MKKRYLVAAAILAFALSASACSGKTASVTKTTTVPMAEASREQDSKEQASKEQASKEQTDTDPEEENASNTSEGVLTGIVDVNKGFMIAVISDEDSESYVFGLDEKQSETYKDIKPGDTVSVTYTNGLPSPDNMDTVVIDIEVE
ncbi:entericidin EcnAB [Enterocloster citroniae]|uniref:entericidin EcnAB n=1 Tax=Enterocloster citroniae TaxID=358743 RepID=UPI00349E7829